jgi:hypothetical protein
MTDTSNADDCCTGGHLGVAILGSIRKRLFTTFLLKKVVFQINRFPHIHRLFSTLPSKTIYRDSTVYGNSPQEIRRTNLRKTKNYKIIQIIYNPSYVTHRCKQAAEINVPKL